MNLIKIGLVLILMISQFRSSGRIFTVKVSATFRGYSCLNTKKNISYSLEYDNGIFGDLNTIYINRDKKDKRVSVNSFFYAAVYFSKNGDIYLWNNYKSLRYLDVSNFKDTLKVHLPGTPVSALSDNYLGSNVKIAPFKVNKKKFFGKYDEFVFKLSPLDKDSKFYQDYVFISYVRELGFVKSQRYQNKKLTSEIVVDKIHYKIGEKSSTYILGSDSTYQVPFELIDANRVHTNK